MTVFGERTIIKETEVEVRVGVVEDRMMEFFVE